MENNKTITNGQYMTVRQPNYKLARRDTWQDNRTAWQNIEDSFIGKPR